MKKSILRNAILPALLLAFPGAHSAHAQDVYPSKPIRLIVPFAPGGGTDVVARAIAAKLSESFGKQVVVDNRAGGGGTIGVETTVRANPDGYTIVLISASYATNAAIYKLPYDAVRDITPVTQIFDSATIVALHPGLNILSVKDLIAYSKAKPGSLNYASSGMGSITHMSTELFDQLAGTRMIHVPYKGTGPAMTELLGGQIQLIFGAIASVMPHIKTGRLRGVAVTSARRTSAAPDLPPIADTVPGYEAGVWYSAIGPKGLAKNVVELWQRDIRLAINLPDMKERMAREGFEPVAGSSAALQQLLAREVEKWRTVVKKGNIRVDSPGA